MAPPLVIWDPAMLGYDLGGEHPLHPVRWQLTLDLAARLGVLRGLDLYAPPPADDDELATIHRRDYIAAVKAASGPVVPRSARASRAPAMGHGGHDGHEIGPRPSVPRTTRSSSTCTPRPR